MSRRDTVDQRLSPVNLTVDPGTDVLEPTAESVERAAEAIRNGEVIVALSDTNLGLTLDPTHAAAVERTDEIKDRPAHEPLTLVLPATDAVPHERCTHEGTVAVGCLSNPGWRALAARVDGPLAMTSANRSGTVDDETLVDVALARDPVGDDVDLLLAGEAQGTTRASTVLDLASDEPTVLRRGDVTPGDLADTGIPIIGV